VNKECVTVRSHHFVLAGDVLHLKEVGHLKNWSWAAFKVFSNELGTKSRRVQ